MLLADKVERGEYKMGEQEDRGVWKGFFNSCSSTCFSGQDVTFSGCIPCRMVGAKHHPKHDGHGRKGKKAAKITASVDIVPSVESSLEAAKVSEASESTVEVARISNTMLEAVFIADSKDPGAGEGRGHEEHIIDEKRDLAFTPGEQPEKADVMYGAELMLKSGEGTAIWSDPVHEALKHQEKEEKVEILLTKIQAILNEPLEKEELKLMEPNLLTEVYSMREEQSAINSPSMVETWTNKEKIQSETQEQQASRVTRKKNRGSKIAHQIYQELDGTFNSSTAEIKSLPKLVPTHPLSFPSQKFKRSKKGLKIQQDNSLTQGQVSAFKAAFEVFQKDGTQKMSLREFQNSMSTVGIHLNHTEAFLAFKNADINRDGRLTFDDFLTVVTDNRRFSLSLDKSYQKSITDEEALEIVLIEALSKLVETAALPAKSSAAIVMYYQNKYKGMIRKRKKAKFQNIPRLEIPRGTSISDMSDKQLTVFMEKIERMKSGYGWRGPYAVVPCIPPSKQASKLSLTSRTNSSSIKSRKPSTTSSVGVSSQGETRVNYTQLRGTSKIVHRPVNIKLDVPELKLRNLTMNDLQHLRQKIKKAKSHFYNEEFQSRQGSMVQLWERLAGDQLSQEPKIANFPRLFKTYSWSWNARRNLRRNKDLKNSEACERPTCTPQTIYANVENVELPATSIEEAEQECEFHWEQDTDKGLGEQENEKTCDCKSDKCQKEFDYFIHEDEIEWKQAMREIQEELEQNARKFRAEWDHHLQDIMQEQKSDLYDVKEGREKGMYHNKEKQKHVMHQMHKEQELDVPVVKEQLEQSLNYGDEKQEKQGNQKWENSMRDIKKNTQKDMTPKEFSSTYDSMKNYENNTEKDTDYDLESSTAVDELELKALNYKDDWEQYSEEDEREQDAECNKRGHGQGTWDSKANHKHDNHQSSQKQGHNLAKETEKIKHGSPQCSKQDKYGTCCNKDECECPKAKYEEAKAKGRATVSPVTP